MYRQNWKHLAQQYITLTKIAQLPVKHHHYTTLLCIRTCLILTYLDDVDGHSVRDHQYGQVSDVRWCREVFGTFLIAAKKIEQSKRRREIRRGSDRTDQNKTHSTPGTFQHLSNPCKRHHRYNMERDLPPAVTCVHKNQLINSTSQKNAVNDWNGT